MGCFGDGSVVSPFHPFSLSHDVFIPVDIGRQISLYPVVIINDVSQERGRVGVSVILHVSIFFRHLPELD